MVFHGSICEKEEIVVFNMTEVQRGRNQTGIIVNFNDNSNQQSHEDEPNKNQNLKLQQVVYRGGNQRAYRSSGYAGFRGGRRRERSGATMLNGEGRDGGCLQYTELRRRRPTTYIEWW